jgi:hypothetical protein
MEFEGVAIRGGDEVPAPAHETYYILGCDMKLRIRYGIPESHFDSRQWPVTVFRCQKSRVVANCDNIRQLHDGMPLVVLLS